MCIKKVTFNEKKGRLTGNGSCHSSCVSYWPALDIVAHMLNYVQHICNVIRMHTACISLIDLFLSCLKLAQGVVQTFCVHAFELGMLFCRQNRIRK